jgi:hypothetical protein
MLQRPNQSINKCCNVALELTIYAASVRMNYKING